MTSPPVARDGDDVRRLSADASLAAVDERVSVCRACPRLVAWREEVAHTKRAAFAHEEYWGRPIPGWGAPDPTVLIVGLAPAAHGGNRTGRIFTGDRSGDWLFASLFRVGLATQPTSTHVGDGLELIRTRMIAAVRCAPPDNRPTTGERDTCAPWLDREVDLLLPNLQVVVALGGFAWDASLRTLRAAGLPIPRPKPKFGHGAEVLLGPADGSPGASGEAAGEVAGAGAGVGEVAGAGGHRVTLLGCYHPSQQNTFTGRLTEPMLDAVLGRAATLSQLR